MRHKWLRKVVPVSVNDNGTAPIVVSLLGGDANNDNFIDILDLDLLLEAFCSVPSDAIWNASADFNNNNAVDIMGPGYSAWQFRPRRRCVEFTTH